MSDRRFGFSSHFQNRCALCLTEDDSNRNIGTAVCQHNASVESALHYLRNYGAPVSPPYASYHSGHDGSTTTTLPAYGGSPPMSPNYYKLAEYLLRMSQMQENGGQQMRQPTSRPPKPKSELGCLRECAFCKSNGETAEFYKSHFLKDPVGRVRCPILQRYQCPFCYATGENAHTRRYCPKNPNKMCFIKGEQFVKQNLQ